MFVSVLNPVLKHFPPDSRTKGANLHSIKLKQAGV